MISFEKYVRAESLAEAYELNQSPKNVIGGGMMWLHLSEAEYDSFIDLCDLGLDQIEEEEEYFKIGAMVSLFQLENCERIKEYYGEAFSDCLRHIVGVQFRNTATIGGSIVARLGFSDVITLLLPLNCKLLFYKQGTISLEEFINAKNQRDVLSHIFLPKKKAQVIYRSVRKNYTDIPILNICAAKDEEGLKMAVGCRPGIAVMVKDDEPPVFGSNKRGSKEYREHLYEVLRKRMIEEMEEV